jgi:DNA-directed RNA polymerase subunit H (RpoH/RPB5)
MSKPEKLLTYEDAVRIRREVRQLESQLPRIMTTAKDAGTSGAQIARDLELTEGRVYQIIRAYRAAQQAEK